MPHKTKREKRETEITPGSVSYFTRSDCADRQLKGEEKDVGGGKPV